MTSRSLAILGFSVAGPGSPAGEQAMTSRSLAIFGFRVAGPGSPAGEQAMTSRSLAVFGFRVALAAACCVVSLSCDSGSKPAARQAAARVAPAAPAAPPAAAASAQAEQPAKPEEPEWSYSSAGKRDPFRSFLYEIERGQGSLATRCATPLGRFELEQLKLVAVITGLEDPVAMVEAPTGVGYSVRRGACIGKNGGVVAAVRSRELVISEWAIRADGTRDRTQTIVRLPKEASFNVEEQPQ